MGSLVNANDDDLFNKVHQDLLKKFDMEERVSQVKN